MRIPSWLRAGIFGVLWAVWQLWLLFVALIVYANLFSEYGAYSHPMVDPIAAVGLFGLAIVVGTVLPFRKWRADRRSRDQ